MKGMTIGPKHTEDSFVDRPQRGQRSPGGHAKTRIEPSYDIWSEELRRARIRRADEKRARRANRPQGGNKS
jgi:hypothetical protein